MEFWLSFEWFRWQSHSSRWNLSVDEQLVILGNVDPKLYSIWTFNFSESLTAPDHLKMRLGILLGVHQFSIRVAPDNNISLANNWFSVPISDTVLNGCSVRDYLLKDSSVSSFRNLEYFLLSYDF